MVDGPAANLAGDVVLVISSLVARGAVGARASQFALERAGLEVAVLPTVLLTWHPGHGQATRIVPERFAAMTEDIVAAPWLGRVGAVLSGYLGDGDQAAAIAGLVAAVKAARPDVVYLCDPVMGDDGGLYIPQATAQVIGNALVPLADIVTPNVHELAWLAGVDQPPRNRSEVAGMAAALDRPAVAVTSAPTGYTGETGAALVQARGPSWLARHPALTGAPHGTGDLFAGLYLAAVINGLEGKAALAHATVGTRAMAEAAVAGQADELPLAARADVLDGAVESMVTIEPLT